MWNYRLWPSCWAGSESHAWWVWSGGGAPLPQSCPSQWLQRYIQDLHTRLSPTKTDHVGGFIESWTFAHSLLDLNFVGNLGCNLDRHEDIGKGCIGISAFRDIVNEPRLDNIPLILETPGRWGNELLMLIFPLQIYLNHDWCWFSPTGQDSSMKSKLNSSIHSASKYRNWPFRG